MPTRRQLSKSMESQFEFPSTRREDDPLYKKPIDPEHLSIDQPSEAYDAAEQLLNEQETSKAEPLKPERTFTLQDMLNCWMTAFSKGSWSEFGGDTKDAKENYFKAEFNIDINHQ